MPATLTKEEREEYTNLFVGAMTPLLEEREAEIKTSLTGQFDTLIQKALDNVNARLNEIEFKGKRPGGGTSGNGRLLAFARSTEEAVAQDEKVAAFKSYVQRGFLRMDRTQRQLLMGAAAEDMEALQQKAAEIRAEFKAFSIADDTLGGYFVLPEFVQNEIIKASVLYSPVRDLARVQPTSSNSVDIPVRKTTLTAGWVAESATRTETLGQSYGRASIQTAEMYAFVLFSRQLLEDEFFNLETDLQADIAEQFGVLEGAAFVNGDAVNGKPQGFLANVVTNV